jgi:LuxR family maltose regulon positive regulatory protein
MRVRWGPVRREDLAKRFLAARSCPIITVIAPAGYGKTTAIRQWEALDERRFIWPSGDHSSDEPPDRLIEQLAVERPCVLVIDDLHHLVQARARVILEQVIDGVPPGVQVVLVGRATPPVALTRRLLDDEVQSFGPSDLAMSTDDATRLLADDGVVLHDDEVTALVQVTEGWAAGIALAAKSVSDDDRPPLHQLSGRNRLVAAYFVEEVLTNLPAELVSFLERSSVLDSMNGPLVDDLLETTGSAQRLRSLHEAGIFIVPLDDVQVGYRYHHLFLEMLRQRLMDRDASEGRGLHLRASAILEAQCDPVGAVRHAIAAGDVQGACDLVLVRAAALVLGGDVEQLREMLDIIGYDAMDRYPAATVSWAWYGLGCAEAPTLIRAITAVEPFAETGPLADGSPTAGTAITMVRAMVGADGIPGILHDTAIVRAAGVASQNPWWGLATLVEGTVFSMLGQDDLSRTRLEESLSVTTGVPTLEAVALAHLALLDLRRDDVTSARHNAERAFTIAERNDLAGTMPAISVYAVTALVHVRTGQLDEAHRAGAVAGAMIDRLDRLAPRAAVLANLVLAQAALALGNLATARDRLNQANAARRVDGTATRLNDDLDRLERQLTEAATWIGDELKLSAAEMRVLAFLPTHLSLQEIAGELLISRNTVKSHAVSIYRKLSVASRSDAITMARRIGILPPQPA